MRQDVRVPKCVERRVAIRSLGASSITTRNDTRRSGLSPRTGRHRHSTHAAHRQKPASSRYFVDPDPHVIRLRSMRYQSGFTLIELVVTIAVASILLTLAIPSFRSTIQNNRVTGQANEFLTSLTLARSEAVKRSAITSVCISSNGATCMGTDWASGWLITVGGTTLRVHEALPSGSTLTASGGATPVTFNPDGSAGATNTFTLSASGIACTRTISISAVGQASVSKPVGCI